MKLPKAPPTQGSLIAEVSPPRLIQILHEGPEWARHDALHLHWDELRFKTPPEGYSHAEWWLGLKLARKASLREVPLRDKEGHPFEFSVPDSLNELVHQIDRELGDRFGLTDGKVTAQDKRVYVANSIIQESITSSQLEGAVTTREVAKKMIQTGRQPRDKSERMILNNYQTMSRIREVLDRELTPGLILELHRIATEGTLEREETSGRLRLPDEVVEVSDAYGEVFHSPPPATELPARIQALCDFANGRNTDTFIHPIVRAIIVHFALAYDHPFVDGNGRTARALFYWCMLRQKYPLFEYISISQFLLKAPGQYYRAFLHTETDDNDLTYFLLHQAGVIRAAVGELKAYIAQRADEQLQTNRMLRGSDRLNLRQQAVIGHALRNPDNVYDIRIHQSGQRISYQTAHDDLVGLVKLGLLIMQKRGRKFQFLVPGDLPDRL